VTRPEPLPDTWYARDFLVLREVARRAEAGESLLRDDIAEALGMEARVVGKARSRLKEDGLLDGREGAGEEVLLFGDLTGKGRRAVGQWPSPDIAADRLLAALESTIVRAPEGEQKTRLQKIRDGFASAGRGRRSRRRRGTPGGRAWARGASFQRHLSAPQIRCHLSVQQTRLRASTRAHLRRSARCSVIDGRPRTSLTRPARPPQWHHAEAA
jgi:hypothetical protein